MGPTAPGLDDVLGQIGLAVPAAAPNGTAWMVLAAGRGAHGLARWAAAESAAFRHDGRSARPMNGAVDAATASQLRVGRIHDRIDALLGDVTSD